jgi:hypothetical protein
VSGASITRRAVRSRTFSSCLSILNEGQAVEYEEVANRGKTSAENLKVAGRWPQGRDATMSVERDDILPPEEAPDASSKLFREYAAEFLELARNATSADQRFLYLKTANIWQETAIRWERDLLKDQERVRRHSTAGAQWGVVREMQPQKA